MTSLGPGHIIFKFFWLLAKNTLEEIFRGLQLLVTAHFIYEKILRTIARLLRDMTSVACSIGTNQKP